MEKHRLTHFQGVQRKGRHLIVSGGDAKLEHAQLFIVRMASRKISGGWKSNLIAGTFKKRDRMVRVVKVDDAQWHPGGLSVCGDILAVPIYSTEKVVSSVPLYLVKNPENPKRINPELDVTRKNEKAGAVALVRLPGSGKFLMAVWSDADKLGRRLDFYLSMSDDIFDGFVKKKQLTWDAGPKGTVLPGGGEFNNYQSTNFVVQKSASGYKLFLAGTYNTVALALGKDYAELFELEFKGDIWGSDPSLGDSVVVTKKASRVFPNDMNFQFNFAAAAGLHVDPRGSLRLYSTLLLA